MFENSKLSLSRIWLLISAFAFILPIFMPSSANPQIFLENVIGTVTVMMFILSFPASLFGLPLLYFVRLVFEINQNSMEAMYLNLFLLFVLGVAQWFWIVPRLARNESRFQMLNLIGVNSEAQFLEAKPANNIPFDAEGQTPLEKVLRDRDSE